MNEKFYALPLEKQERIINAGFHVFANNSYKKSPVQEIAHAAGISKSLLFFYFRNKKELYLFLWQKAEEITLNTLKELKTDENADFFEKMYQSLLFKTKILKTYPDIMSFAIRVYYEDDPEVKQEVRQRISPYTGLFTNPTLSSLDPADFKESLDLEQMYRMIYLTSEGYIRQVSQGGTIETEKVLAEYKKMIDFWKTLFLR